MRPDTPDSFETVILVLILSTPHPLISNDNAIFEKIKDNTIALHEMERKDVDNKYCTNGEITQYIKSITVVEILHILSMRMMSMIHNLQQ